MRHVYDVFEKFHDGSTLWRTFVTGRFEADRKIQELTEHSENEFYLMEIEAEDFRPTTSPRRYSRPLTKNAAAG